MEKSLLKQVVAGLTENQEITINFREKSKHVSTVYRVLGTKKGRGKGGSLLAELVPASETTATDENILVIGTPDNDEFLNVVVNGETLGYTSEDQVPVIYEPNLDRAAELKTQFLQLFAPFFDGHGSPVRISVVSTAPELNREFTVTGARKLRGRNGQVALETAEGPELWSRRLSGVIESVTIVEN